MTDKKKLFVKGKNAVVGGARFVKDQADKRADRQARSIAKCVEPFGLRYLTGELAEDQQVSGLLLEGRNDHVVETTVEPRIQFGNNGTKAWISDDTLRPSLHGYIAVPITAPTPRLFVDGAAFGSVTPVAVASLALHVLSIFDLEGGTDTNSSVLGFRRKSELLDLPKHIGFRVMCEKDRLADGQALMTTEACELLGWLSRSFSLELSEGWLIAYTPFGEISTDDVEVWQWAASAASRLIDLARLWGADAGLGATWQGYTEERLERPQKMEGMLSPKRWR